MMDAKEGFTLSCFLRETCVSLYKRCLPHSLATIYEELMVEPPVALTSIIASMAKKVEIEQKRIESLVGQEQQFRLDSSNLDSLIREKNDEIRDNAGGGNTSVNEDTEAESGEGLKFGIGGSGLDERAHSFEGRAINRSKPLNKVADMSREQSVLRKREAVNTRVSESSVSSHKHRKLNGSIDGMRPLCSD